MIPREAESHVRELLRAFPVVTITGPRQSGKTTLARKVMADRPYVSLEEPDTRQMALDDPRGFLTGLPDGGILDEVQRAPELLSYIQTQVDESGRMGRFLLTGSQQFGLMSHITQSLAGRSAFLELLPFSLAEQRLADTEARNLDDVLFSGGYPPIHDRWLSPDIWLSAYVRAYLERDVRQVLDIQDLDSFQRFVRLCAGRSGQLLNRSALASECGISRNTARSWISVLEASYILFQLKPHHANFNKRLTKSPKLYFFDTGLLCWLLGIRNASQLATHPLRGAIFETFILSEMMKNRFNCGERPELYFWRDSHGHEIDVLCERGTQIKPIEIKSGQTINRDFFKGLDYWVGLAGEQTTDPMLVYGGQASHQRHGVRVIGWEAVGSL